MVNSKDEVLEMLAAIEQFSVQRCLDFAVLMERAQLEENELGYNTYKAKYIKWFTIRSQIECATVLIGIE